MKVYQIKELCSGCTACKSSCPVKAINMVEDIQGFLYPQIDENKCIHCDLCKKVCPFIKKKTDANLPYPLVIALKNKSATIRSASSSGGFFYGLTSYVLNNNGIVYGAAFDKNFCIIHKRGSTFKDIEEMQGSKYVQSDMSEIFPQVRHDLKEGKLVLFTGCPCQIDGLNNYLQGHKYKNLIMCDLICHGTPSPRIWMDYLCHIQKKYNGIIRKINFRSKFSGWHTPVMEIRMDSGIYRKTDKEDFFYKIFYSSCALRPSCYTCKYTNLYKISDFTMGDFWGIQNVLPEMDDNKGVSLILLNTENGKSLFEMIKDNFDYELVDIAPSIPDMLKYPTPCSPHYESFWNDYELQDLNYIGKKYLGLNLCGAIKRFIRKYIRLKS